MPGFLCTACSCLLLRYGPRWPWAVLGEVTKGQGEGQDLQSPEGIGGTVTDSCRGQGGGWQAPGAPRAGLGPGSVQGGRVAGWLLRARRGAWAQGPQAEVGGAAALASGRCAPCEPLRHEAVITCSVLWAESQGASGEVFVVACESGTHEKSGGCRSGKIRALVLPHAASSSGMPGPPPVPARQGPCPRLPGRSPAR